MPAKILNTIVQARKDRIVREGYDQGVSSHFLRNPDGPSGANGVLSVQPFSSRPLVICEVKRKSPSRGDISPELDPVAQAAHYAASGVSAVSVLTEQDHFNGGLKDLIAVKKALPQISVLRKDFLFDEEDIRVSYAAGADAVLLIAAILEPSMLARLYELSRELGMTALVEVHNSEELECVRMSGIQPELMGINARNLHTFQVDMLKALQLRKRIEWECDVVFESGIFAPSQAAHAAAFGFRAVLVGEAAVKDPLLPGKLMAGLSTPENYPQAGIDFWDRLMSVRAGAWMGGGASPLVKVCGICRMEDALYAVNSGADILGFVFAESPRKAGIQLLEGLKDLDVLKVAVVTAEPGEELIRAWSNGLIHAFQYHGDESPEECLMRGLPFYKALSVKSEKDIPEIMSYASPRVLIDAYSSQARGGTGRSLNDDLVELALAQKPLWLAGGLNPDNVLHRIQQFHPEMLDVSSGLEVEPGVKDHAKITRFFKEIQRADIQ